MTNKLLFEDEFLRELEDLKIRAIKIGYKNKFPKLPKQKYNLEQSMIGFRYRLNNWKKQLLQMENPGGLPSVKKVKPVISTDSLLENGNFVIKKSNLLEEDDIIS